MIKTLSIALVASLVSLASHAAIAPISNGSFEFNNVDAGKYKYASDLVSASLPPAAANVSATDWLFSNGAGVASNNSDFGGTASTGSYYAFLQNIGSITQSFTAAS